MKKITLLSLIFLVQLVSNSVADDTYIDIEYSHRQVSDTPIQDPDVIEGSVIAYYTANNPIYLAEPDESVVRISDTEFQYTFLWDEITTKTITFIDDMSIEIEIESFPEPVLSFDPANHDLPVINITTDPANLWDSDIGIHVWGNNENCFQHLEDWEREALFEYYDAGNNLAISRNVGIRIHGNWSRSFKQKSIRIYFDHFGDTNSIDFDFLNSDPTSFERILLRTGRTPYHLTNSALIDNLFLELGHLASRYNYNIIYLNGEYRGITTTRERIDEEFFEHTHGFDSADYIYVKDGVIEHGDQNAWPDFRDTINNHPDHSSHDFFQYANSNFNLESYIDWLSLVIFGASPGNGADYNLVVFKPENGKWQYLPWDEDTFFNSFNLNSDFFTFLSSESETEYYLNFPPRFHQPFSSSLLSHFLLFHNLMNNAEFRALFSDRIDSLLDNQLYPTNLIERIDDFAEPLWPETALHGSFVVDNFSYASYINSISNWVTDRHPIVTSQKEDFMASYREEVELTEFSAEPNGSQVNISWRTETETDNLGFILYRSIGTPDNMIEIASYLTHPELIGQGATLEPTEYSFIDSDPVSGELNYYQLEHINSSSEVVLHNWVESAWNISWDGLVINELMADNENTIDDEYDEDDDWFELYNGSEYSINLNGWYLTDDLSEPTMHQITTDLELAPGEYLLLWADNEDDFQGANHVSFKLSADGDQLGLVGPDGVTFVDSLTFEAQLEDVSLARISSDTGLFHYNSIPTPEYANSNMTNEMMLCINEVMSNNVSTITDEQSEFDPWIEIYNPLPISINSNILSILVEGTIWAMPDYNIEAGEHLIIWADNEPEDGIMHTNFDLSIYNLISLYSSESSMYCDQINFPELDADISYARIPDGGDYMEQTAEATPGEANPNGVAVPMLVVNEFMAKNNSTIQDEMGSWEDWVEIYNYGPFAVNMEGMYLTDDLGSPTKWEFPDVTIASGEFIIVWCDDDENDGPLHTSFKLGASGEDVGLYDTDDNLNQSIDAFSYSSQSADISYGRTTDAGEAWAFFSNPTPGETNFSLSDVPAELSAIQLLPNHPNPFNPQTTIKFWLPEAEQVKLQIFDTAGRVVKSLASGQLQPGWRSVVWNGTNSTGQYVASGIYYYRLKTEHDSKTMKMLLLK
jgi:hypothetical protein